MPLKCCWIRHKFWKVAAKPADRICPPHDPPDGARPIGLMPRFIRYLQRVCADQFAVVSGASFAPTSTIKTPSIQACGAVAIASGLSAVLGQIAGPAFRLARGAG